MILRQEFLNIVCMNSVFILDETIVDRLNSKIFHLPPHLLRIRTTMISTPIKNNQTGFYSTVILSILYLLMSAL